ncbi:MAG: hypothetical protein EA397_16625 [Deltaproteobacteria bacterium]|nr:MAG: hypothetical protein EA397_16625 [Deltaproteobacteria bacterium]
MADARGATLAFAAAVVGLLAGVGCDSDSARGEFHLEFRPVPLELPAPPQPGDLVPLSEDTVMVLVRETQTLARFSLTEQTLVREDVVDLASFVPVLLVVTAEGALLRTEDRGRTFEVLELPGGARATSVRHRSRRWSVGAVAGGEGIVLSSEDGRTFVPHHQGLQVEGGTPAGVAYTERYSTLLRAWNDQGAEAFWRDEGEALTPQAGPPDLTVPAPPIRSHSGWYFSVWDFDGAWPDVDVLPIAMTRRWSPDLTAEEARWMHGLGLGLPAYPTQIRPSLRPLGLDGFDRLYLVRLDQEEPVYVRSLTAASAVGDRYLSAHAGPGCLDRYRGVDQRVGSEPEASVSVRNDGESRVFALTLSAVALTAHEVEPGREIEVSAPADHALLVVDEADHCLAFEPRIDANPDGVVLR